MTAPRSGRDASPEAIAKSPLLALLALLLALSGCAPGSAGRDRSEIDLGRTLSCEPRFPYQDGWLGGDGVYSVPLSETETLWLFGDSFVGEPDAVDRIGSSFVHNSIGVSRCIEGRWEIDYYWGRNPDLRPDAFLSDRPAPSPSGERWVWLFDGFLHEGRLHLGLLEVEASEPEGALQLPFRFVSTRLARISNPQAPPDQWQVTTFPLWSGSPAYPVSAMVVDRGWLHLFAFLSTAEDRHPRILTRVPLTVFAKEIPNIPAAIQYLARDGSWRPGIDPTDARILMEDNATEMSVRWHPDRERWIATYSHPNAEGRLARGQPSDKVYIRTAEALEGPWSAPHPVFDVPEQSNRPSDAPEPSPLCYAAKEPIQYRRPGEITFTYVCNLFTPQGGDPWPVLERLMRTMDLYRPRTVRVPLPSAPTSERVR